MSKKIVALVVAAAFTVGFAGITLAAKKVACEVKSVDGSTVTLNCTDAAGLKAGDKVSVAATAAPAPAAKKEFQGC